jgi:hypothetical protein
MTSRGREILLVASAAFVSPERCMLVGKSKAATIKTLNARVFVTLVPILMAQILSEIVDKPEDEQDLAPRS